MAIEEPKYAVVERNGDFEIRDYQAAVAAEVTVPGDQWGAANAGFRLLARYIFGGNSRRQSIAMTAPVAQAPLPEKIAMTAPVTQTPSGNAWTVRFTMPSAYSLDTLPKPNDPRVKLTPVPAARMAVLSFSGLARKPRVAEKSAELLKLTTARQLSAVGAVSLAQYNPPWTLWFLRRNEVMVQLTP